MKNKKYLLLNILVFSFFYLNCEFDFEDNIYSQELCYDLNCFKVDDLFNKNNIVPVVVIGSGPAGLMAAVYASRGGMHTIMFTGNAPGGQLNQASNIENWPGIKQAFGWDIIDGLFEQAKEYKVSIVEDMIKEIDFKSWPFVLKTSSGKEVNALSIIIATGSAPRKLGIPGELEYWGRGVSPCAICDCHFFKGKDVVIIGGGDTAVEEAMQLAPYAKNIYILVRDKRMKAVKLVKDKLDDYDNVKVIYNKEVLKIIGNGKVVTSIEVKDNLTNEINMMNIDGVFLAIGQNPNTELFKDSLALNKFGYIIVDPITQETSIKGIYAAGDVEDAEYKQAIIAAAAGCKSALRAIKFLREIGITNKVIKILSKNYLII